MAANIKFDLDLCNSCKTCVDACFIDVIRWDDKKEQPFAAYPEDCALCLGCEEACPAQCIEVIPVQVSAAPR
jgi:NAD-dependent dihydropyrimidine dehydrogenase PreA subunit